VRILIDYRPALRQRTGVGEYVHQLVRSLSRLSRGPLPGRGPLPDGLEKLELTIFTSSWKDRPGSSVAELGDVRVVDRRVPVRLLNFCWHRFGWPPVESFAPGTYDLVHSLHPLRLPSRRAAQVVTIHDLDFLTHRERTNAEIRRDYAALVRKHAQRADAIITPSRYTARGVTDTLSVSPERVFVCSPGAPRWERPFHRSPAGEDEGYALFVGTLEPRKNVGKLIAAYAELLRRRPGAPKLVLAGGVTPEARAWVEAAKQSPLKGQVEFRGYVPESERHSLYERARLLVLPSFDEGFGLPVLEAMSAGVPVIASDRGALPEVIGDAGLLVDPEDEKSIAAALEQVLFDQEYARACSERGLRRASRYSWDAAAAAVMVAYRAAIAHRRQRR
jgi:glycosyltransferase involved in cell wall biosynthesis